MVPSCIHKGTKPLVVVHDQGHRKLRSNVLEGITSPPRRPVPTHVKPFRVNNDVSLEGEVEAEWCDGSGFTRQEGTHNSARKFLRNGYRRRIWMRGITPPLVQSGGRVWWR